MVNEKEIEKETERLSELTMALAAKRRLKGMENYSPNRKQLAGHTSLARTVLYCGGNRAGKSTFGAMEMAYAMTKSYPEWYPQRKRFHGPTKGVVSATSFGVVMRVKDFLVNISLRMGVL